MAVIRKYADAAAVADALIDEWTLAIPLIVAERGRCTIALSGGSTPKTLFQRLVARGKAALPWHAIELYWGDERCVPPDHADSNFGMAERELIRPFELSADRVWRIRGEAEPEVAVAEYRELLARVGRFDYVLLGMGSDGHCASLFPGSPAVDNVVDWFVANPVDSPLAGGKKMRLTMTTVAINWARRVRFLVCGADKAATLKAVVEGGADGARYPAQLIRPLVGDLAWLVDRAAAQELS